jgi:hypothetical protein
MGKKSRLKKERTQLEQKQTPQLMDPALIEAWTKGRTAGFNEGKVDGITETLQLFDRWVTEIDDYVKGIGPITKYNLQSYFADRIAEAVNDNQINDGRVSILRNDTKKQIG